MVVRKEESVIFSIDELDELPSEFKKELGLLREILEWSPEAITDSSGNRIVVFLLRASNEIVIEVKPADSANISVHQCKQILAQSVRAGLFDQLCTTLEVYRRIRPLILYFAQRFAQLESMNVSLIHAGGDGYAN